MAAIVGFVIGLACGAMFCWILLALAHKARPHTDLRP